MDELKPDLVSVFLLGSALVDVLLGFFVYSRRDGKEGLALVAVLLASTWWSLCYAAELTFRGHSQLAEQLAGDVKYVGIVLLPVAWLIFTLVWAGRSDLVRWPVVTLVLVEPISLLVLLANPATHDLVRRFNADGEIVAGPLFWWHLAYMMIVMVGTALVFVSMIARRRYTHRAQVFVLAGSVLVPFVVSTAFNLEIKPFARYDLTPLAFTLSGVALTWGMWQQHLMRLAPVAHSQVVEGMTDGVLVLDSAYQAVDCNPAALAALGWPARGWQGTVLPPPLSSYVTRLGTHEVRIDATDRTGFYEAQVSDLAAQRGHEGGRLVVLRDISERRRLERQRATMLAEQARVAETLSRSLRPAQLPVVPGLALGAEYRPAGMGDEIGGDFYDVYPVDEEWAFSLGDVSGKGARSAAVTALARYTLRALTRPGDLPSQTVSALNNQLLAETEDQEIYLTVVHGRVQPVDDGLKVSLCLGGHPRPLLVPVDPADEIWAVGEPGTAIGLLDVVETVDTTVMLRPGDAIVSFTDGVTEARMGRDFFGEEGLAEVLEQLRGAPAQVIAEGVLDAVLRYQDQVAADDIAVLVLQAPGVPAEIDVPEAPLAAALARPEA